MSGLLLMPLIVLLPFLVSSWRAPERRSALFLIAAVVIIPPVLHLAGKYPIYYTWTVFVPLCGLVALALDQPLPRLLSVGIATLAGAAMLAGLPARLVVAVLEQEARDYSAVSRFVADRITTDDIVYADFQGYYPAKLKAKATFSPTYLGMMSLGERRAVTIAILNVGNRTDEAGETRRLQFIEKNFEGRWERAAPTFAPTVNHSFPGLGLAQPYALSVYRRALIGRERGGKIGGSPLSPMAFFIDRNGATRLFASACSKQDRF